MYFKVKTKQQKQLDKINKVGHWHKFFVFWPREIKTAQGQSEYAFFTTVYRKAQIHYYRSFEGGSGFSFYYRYRKSEDCVLESLAEGDELDFSSDDSRQEYNRLKEWCHSD